MIFESDLIDDYSKPVILFDDVYEGCKTLIDTGADYAVYQGDISNIEHMKVYKYKDQVLISGFGGDGEWCDMYCVNLKLGDLIYPSLPVVHKYDSESPYDMILPGIMFQKFNFNIDFINKKFKVENDSNQLCYNYEIVDENGKCVILKQEVYSYSEYRINLVKDLRNAMLARSNGAFRNEDSTSCKE